MEPFLPTETSVDSSRSAVSSEPPVHPKTSDPGPPRGGGALGSEVQGGLPVDRLLRRLYGAHGLLCPLGQVDGGRLRSAGGMIRTDSTEDVPQIARV